MRRSHVIPPETDWVRGVTRYARDLVQLPAERKVPADPALWKCDDTGVTENLWLNLSTGHIGSGRQVGCAGCALHEGAGDAVGMELAPISIPELLMEPLPCSNGVAPVGPEQRCSTSRILAASARFAGRSWIRMYPTACI